jgi:DNA-binding protein H-NS
MAEFDVETLSLKELKSLQKDLAKAISTFEDRQKSDARSKLEIIAKEMGYSLGDLIGGEVKPSRAPTAAKYRHPENAALTWSDRGANRCGLSQPLTQANRPRTWQSTDRQYVAPSIAPR